MSLYADPAAGWRYSRDRRRANETGDRAPYFSSSMSESPITGSFPSFNAPGAHQPSRDDFEKAGPSRSPVATVSSGLSSLPDRGAYVSGNRPASRSSRSPVASMRARDFAIDEQSEDSERFSGGNGTAAENHDRETISTFSFVDKTETGSYASASRPTRPSPPQREMTEPLRVPPVSAHDPFVSRYLASMGSSSQVQKQTQIQSQTNPSSPQDQAGPSSDRSARPGAGPHGPLMRSSSAPGVPFPTATSEMLSSPLEDASPLETATVDGTPIFEVFNAQLSQGGIAMVKLLKTHLEDVLEMQSEVAKMHLNLEGLGTMDTAPTNDERDRRSASGTDGEAEDFTGVDSEKIQAREKGVEDIMNRLSALSTTLRTYHAHGTPKLVFPSGGPAPQRKSRTRSIDPASAARDTSGPAFVPEASHAAKQPSQHRSTLQSKASKLALDLETPPRSTTSRDQVFVDSPRVLSFDDDVTEGGRGRLKKTSIDLPPLSLRDVPSPQGTHMFTSHQDPQRRARDDEDLARQASMRNMARAHRA